MYIATNNPLWSKQNNHHAPGSFPPSHRRDDDTAPCTVPTARPTSSLSRDITTRRRPRSPISDMSGSLPLPLQPVYLPPSLSPLSLRRTLLLDASSSPISRGSPRVKSTLPVRAIRARGRDATAALRHSLLERYAGTHVRR